MRTALALLLLVMSGALRAQAIVAASAPEKVAVTVYRDPDRGIDDAIDPDWPKGFAMISETRTVTLPPGKSTVRFEGVAESMAAVTAIVTGLPSGVIEKNRNADLLSPAALVDGMLGNRVTITRTNPATGVAASEEAIVRTRADGGLVLQTRAGYEAVRCSGLPEKLSFPSVPEGLSASPIFTLNVDDPNGGTYRVTLSYLASGFDWGAHYVATLPEGGRGDALTMRMLAWLTIANDNGQSFADAELMAIAGKINLETHPKDLSEPANGRPLSLTCYPLGSTAAGSWFEPPAPPPPPAPMMDEEAQEYIVVTGARAEMRMMASPVAVTAVEEQLGDLKLYRVPIPMTVAANALKQVAFLDRSQVRGEMLYASRCWPGLAQEASDEPEPVPANILLATRNDKAHGLGIALPMGMMSLFEPAAGEDRFVHDAPLRDYAVGEEIELPLADSTTVFSQCAITGHAKRKGAEEQQMRLTISNANRGAVKMRIILGPTDDYRMIGAPGALRVKDGMWIVEVPLAGGQSRVLSWRARDAD